MILRLLILGFAITGPASAQAIRDSATVQSDNASLFLELRGADSTRPVVLFLHGGPADPLDGLMSFMAYGGPELEREFVMVYLYQRGVAKSGPAPVASQSLPQHVKDVDRVIDYLKRRFRNAPVSLVGHSWGGTLATAYLLDHGDKLNRAVVICSILNNRRNDTEGYRLVLEQARARQNADAIRELEAVGPPPWNSLDQILVQRRWAGRLSSAPNVRADRARSLRAGGYQRADTTWQSTQMAIVQHMLPSFLNLDLDPRLPNARTPLLLIACGKDLIVPPSAIRPSFDRYGGQKEWLLFENSGHDAYVQETERFAREVTRFLRAGS